MEPTQLLAKHKEAPACLSNKAVARELDIADGTVKVHVKHLLKKLNLRSRLEAAVWAIEHRRPG